MLPRLFCNYAESNFVLSFRNFSLGAVSRDIFDSKNKNINLFKSFNSIKSTISCVCFESTARRIKMILTFNSFSSFISINSSNSNYWIFYGFKFLDFFQVFFSLIPAVSPLSLTHHKLFFTSIMFFKWYDK